MTSKNGPPFRPDSRLGNYFDFLKSVVPRLRERTRHGSYNAVSRAVVFNSIFYAAVHFSLIYKFIHRFLCMIVSNHIVKSQAGFINLSLFR